MVLMKRCLLTSLLAFYAVMLFAQDSPLEKLYDSFSNSCVTLKCIYSVNMSQTSIRGNVVVTVQDDAYHMSGNGLEILCDGETVWTMDPVTKEVMIESVGTEALAYMNNPALLFVNLEQVFEIRRQTRGTDYVFYELLSKEDCGIYGADVTVSDDGVIRNGVFSLSDGNTMKVDVESVKKSARLPLADFRPDFEFGSDWVVTDLR